MKIDTFQVLNLYRKIADERLDLKWLANHSFDSIAHELVELTCHEKDKPLVSKYLELSAETLKSFLFEQKRRINRITMYSSINDTVFYFAGTLSVGDFYSEERIARCAADHGERFTTIKIDTQSGKWDEFKSFEVGTGEIALICGQAQEWENQQEILRKYLNEN